MSDLKVNYTYFVLTNAAIPKDSPWYRGVYGDLKRTRLQANSFDNLWQGKSINCIGATTEALLRLLQCSEYWPSYINKYDPINTYDNKLTPSIEVMGEGLSYNELQEWSRRIIVPSSPEYKANSSAVEKFISSIYSLLTMKDG